MKIGIVSDLHLEFRDAAKCADIVWKIRDAKCDLIVMAGDIHPSKEFRENLIESIETGDNLTGSNRSDRGDTNKPVRFVMGNHDWYHSDFYVPDIEDANNIVSSPLFTNFAECPNTIAISAFRINDFRMTRMLDPNRYRDAYYDHVDHIFDSKAAVVVTHWSPTMKAVSKRFEGELLNSYFCNNLDERIKNSNKKLWVFGHVHSRWDFMIGDCRMVSNPVGYPREISEAYDVKIVEV